MSTITPLAVWDANARRYFDICIPVMEYMTSQDLPIVDTYRVEVYLIDTPFARLFTYAHAPSKPGWRYVDMESGDAAVNEPYDVPLTALPPDGLRLVMQ